MADLPTLRAYVRLIGPAFEDLQRLAAVQPQIVRWALKKMLLLERDPEAGEPLLGSLVGWRKLVVGNRDWRIVWRVSTDDAGATVLEVAEVWAVGARSDADVYAEMTARVGSLPNTPATITLADVVERFGRAGRGVAAASEPAGDPVPRWLADRLVHQVGIALPDVAAMTGEQAFGVWEAFITKQPPGG